MRSLDFWLLFFVFGCGTGIGLMFVNNLGEVLALSMHSTDAGFPVHVCCALRVMEDESVSASTYSK
jgi:hypothetical protein